MSELMLTSSIIRGNRMGRWENFFVTLTVHIYEAAQCFSVPTQPETRVKIAEISRALPFYQCCGARAEEPKIKIFL